jgi:hypothetical protein
MAWRFRCSEAEEEEAAAAAAEAAAAEEVARSWKSKH